MVRIFRHYVPKWLLIVGSTEALILFAAVYAGISPVLFEFNPTAKLLVGGIWPKAVVFTATLMACMAAVGLYQRSLRERARFIALRLAVAFAAAAVILTGLTLVLPALSVGTVALGFAFAGAGLGILLCRLIVYQYVDADVFKRKVLVVGTGTLAEEIDHLRRATDWRNMSLVGYVSVEGEPVLVNEAKVLHRKTTLLQLAKEHGVDLLVVAVRDQPASFPINQILDCKLDGIEVIDLLAFFEQATGKIKLEALSPHAMIFSDGFVQAIVKSRVHRMFDIVVSTLFLIATLPIIAVTAIAIFAESNWRGPVLYRQVRVGRGNQHFEILKFRSMSIDAEQAGQPQWATVNDSRVTRVGSFIRKTRIDELPQLINVLRGEMSFVGPRPERPEFVEELDREIRFYRHRHRVNPGITGWAQICYPYGASVNDAREKLQYDLYYIKNFSLFLDITILIQTAQVILWGKGAR